MIVAFISAAENIRDLAKYKGGSAQARRPEDSFRARSSEINCCAMGAPWSLSPALFIPRRSCASQMSMQLAYELASAKDAETLEILRETILILVPSANPDGVDIVADWYRRTLGTAAEGSEPPELYHAYAGHDNNRDWFMLELARNAVVIAFILARVVSANRLRRSSARLDELALLYASVLRPAESAHRAAAAARSRAHRPQNRRRFAGCGTARRRSLTRMYDAWWHGGFRTAPYYHNSIGIPQRSRERALNDAVTTISAKELSESFHVAEWYNALAASDKLPGPLAWRLMEAA
ncbi:MAG: M14 family zinc carboxypeptidase [Pyrinomonadaceae bacterium]